MYALGSDSSPIDILVPYSIGKVANRNASTRVDHGRVSVFHLNAVHVPAGREWLGRRDGHGATYWEACYRSAGPGAVYSLGTGHGTGAIAS
jgi:hypothetical protein